MTRVRPFHHLEELAERLQRKGFYARLNLPVGKPPNLCVVCPGLPTVQEHVVVEPIEGAKWFWWTWPQRIAPVSDMDSAVSGIRRVLGGAVG